MVWRTLQPYSEDVLDDKSRRGLKKTRQEEPVTPGSSPEKSPMSPDRAFVVQFHELSGPGSAWFAGRVEHVMSGQNTGFVTPEELVEFFRVMNQQIPPSQRSTKQ
jgi:hypothetical protein